MKKSLYTRGMSKNVENKYEPNLAEWKKGQYFIPQFFDLFKKIKAFHPHVVITRETNATSLYVSLICRILGIKSVIVYNQVPLYRKKKSGILEKLKSIIKIVCFPRVRITTVRTNNPTHFQNNMDQYYIKRHDYFIPFIEEVKGMERTYCKNGTVGILSVGKYRDYKNHFLLIDAISLLKDRGGLRVAIAGQAYNEEETAYYDRLETYIKDKGLADIVTLYKNIEYAEMDNLYAEYDIFILASKKEQASIAVLEAMANGMVAISTDANGTASYIEEGKCGYLFRTMDAKDLASKIEKYISKKELIGNMGRAACENIREHYSFMHYYTALGDILQKEFKIVLTEPERA
jgi:glycosyltransferase involved in cell wall biosynthesis